MYKNLEYQVLLRITDNCNFECRHCCYSCGHGKDTMSVENIKKVIDNLPKNTSMVTVTGGEVFTVKNTLYQALEYLKNNMKSSAIAVQTNGYWIGNSEKLEAILDELKEFNVKYLAWTGNDKFHKEQGLDTKRLASLLEPYSQSNAQKPKIRIKNEEDKVFPFGRAKQLKKNDVWSRKDKYDYCETQLMLELEDTFSITIHPDYSASPCCWKINGLTMGSALDNPVEQLLENTFSNSTFYGLFNFGPISVASKLLGSKKAEKLSKNTLDCVLCEKMFKKINENGPAGI